MTGLSVGANLAWQAAVHEAVTAKFQFIEPEHVFIGICGLEKLLNFSPEDSGLNAQDYKALQEEDSILQDLIKEFGLSMVLLRQGMRKRLGTGNYIHTEKVIHRSEKCKVIFDRAYELASSTKKITSLHLLAAILEKSGIVSKLISEAHVETGALLKQAINRMADKGSGLMESAHKTDAPHLEDNAQ